jgi:small-conductance mechanosensitive channel
MQVKFLELAASHCAQQQIATGWQRELDQIQTELGRPRLRYSELNEFRDRLQRVRSEIEDTWSRLQPRLKADKAQMALLGPASAADQPPEPEQAVLARAELNHHLSLLSGAKQPLIQLIFALRIY